MRVRPECRSFGQSVPLYDKLPLGCARKTFIRGMHSLSGHRISGCAASSFGRNFGACAVVGAIPQEQIPKFAPCNCLQGKDISLASDGSGYRIDHPPDRARMCRVGANRIGDHHEPRRRSRGEVSAQVGPWSVLRGPDRSRAGPPASTSARNGGARQDIDRQRDRRRRRVTLAALKRTSSRIENADSLPIHGGA
jgi:hypothetical protein